MGCLPRPSQADTCRLLGRGTCSQIQQGSYNVLLFFFVSQFCLSLLTNETDRSKCSMNRQFFGGALGVQRFFGLIGCENRHGCPLGFSATSDGAPGAMEPR